MSAANPSTSQRVLQLYRQILRLARTWNALQPEETPTERAYIRQEARRQFRENAEVHTLHALSL